MDPSWSRSTQPDRQGSDGIFAQEIMEENMWNILRAFAAMLQYFY